MVVNYSLQVVENFQFPLVLLNRPSLSLSLSHSCSLTAGVPTPLASCPPELSHPFYTLLFSCVRMCSVHLSTRLSAAAQKGRGDRKEMTDEQKREER